MVWSDTGTGDSGNRELSTAAAFLKVLVTSDKPVNGTD